jgi:hypothetical protein
MQRVSSGYTIVEVIIFLAISGAILISSIAFLSGSEGHNRFSQSMRDTQSKIQDLLNDIPTGNTGGLSSVTGLSHCFHNTGSGKTQIDSGPANTGNPNHTNGGCIFLGKAIQFTDATDPPAAGQAAGQQSKVFIYSVFGNRTYTPPIGDERPVANMIEAVPFAAVASGNCCSGTADLTEEYKIPGGAKVKKIIKPDSGITADSHLAGFFLSFNQLLATSSGSASLRAFQFPISGNHVAGNVSSGTNDIEQCIKLNNSGSATCSLGAFPPDQWPPALSEWKICFSNDTNKDTAILTISSAGGLNATTKLEFTEC